MPQFSLDIRNAIIPFSLLEISHLFKKLKAGEIIEIIAQNQKIRTDIEHILSKFDYEISQHDVFIDNTSSLQILLKKKPTASGKPVYTEDRAWKSTPLN